MLLYIRDARAPWTLRTVMGDAQAILGVPAASLKELWTQLVHPEDAAGLKASLAALEQGRSVTLDYRVLSTLGGERWVRDSVRWVPSPNGGDELVGLLRDVSVERTLRSQVAALEERIWRSQRMDSLGEIAAGIAHDLGNLFAGVLGMVQEMEADPELPRHVREDLAVVRESASRGSGFVKQILRFAARERYRPGPLDLNRVVDDLKVILGRSLGPGVRLSVETDPDLPQLQSDAAQLEQVLLNLAVNAREAMPGGGLLSIRTERLSLEEPLRTEGTTLLPGLYIRLTVTDTGQGIAEEVRGRIFQPFFSTKTRAQSGSGLGLSTVERIVRGLGGGITVESEERKGTRFRIYLPVRAAAPALPQVEGPRDDREARGRVLVVEDDPAVRDVTRRILAREGFSVTTVGAAREALQTFDRTRPPFDVIVCDIALPDRSGPELLRMLRNRIPELPVVYVSGYGKESLPVPGDPFSSFLEKPFTPQDLVKAVLNAITTVGATVREAEGTNGG